MDAAKSSARLSYEERRKNLRDRRKEAGLSQIRLARLSGLDVFSLCRYENGHRSLRESVLRRLEASITDYVETQRIAAVLHGQRAWTAALSELSPPPRGTKGHREARERFVGRGVHSISRLTCENARLCEELALVKNVIEKLEEQNRILHEVSTLQGEVVTLFQQEGLPRPSEADSLLRRAAQVEGKL